MLYQRRSSPIHRLNPLTKLVWLGSTTIIAIAGPGWWLPLAVLVGIIAPLAIVGQVASVLARYLVLVLAPSVAGIVVLQGVLHQPAPTVLFDVLGVPVRAEGLRYGARVGGQLAVVGAASALVLLTTPPSALIADLTRR
ncbi:MAG: energy-coupling factor transporter transmembrane protein EcfT, partial [Dehalococcoidia bacterium]|nr:energy-coupling factor transporter transmembrane protein EcfT [Dehalococcoidia bacterium]